VGAWVRVHVPASVADSRLVHAQPHPRHILIVDADLDRAGEVCRMLASASAGWRVETALSGRGALAALAARHFDILVTDLHVSGMGSGALLSTAAREYPDTIRLVRGSRAGERPMLAAACAHQFLPEPLEEAALVAQVSRAFALRDTLASAELRAIVGRMTTVPTLPALYTAVVGELQRLHVSTHRIGALVADDPAMAAKLLQMVNSPFFGRQMRVSDPAHAVQLLGLDTVRGLVLSTHVFDMFRRPTRGAVDIERLWQHASEVSALAGSLAQIEGAGPEVVQDARTGGLLHDIGKLLLVATLPAASMRVRDRARLEGRPVCEVERDELGVTHAELGAYLLGLWGLPDPIVEATAWHHHPPSAAPRGSSALSFVVAANVLTAVPRRAPSAKDTDTAMSRLLSVLAPFGVDARASHWLDWTLASAAA
jgi:putative nucleotidyltransferase with HDIG domain